MAERSEAKSAKRSFASKISKIFTFDAKLRFALFGSLRSAIFLAKFKSTTNWSLYPKDLTPCYSSNRALERSGWSFKAGLLRPWEELFVYIWLFFCFAITFSVCRFLTRYFKLWTVCFKKRHRRQTRKGQREKKTSKTAFDKRLSRLETATCSKQKKVQRRPFFDSGVIKFCICWNSEENLGSPQNVLKCLLIFGNVYKCP